MAIDKYSHIEGRRDLVFVDNLENLQKKVKAVVFDLDGTLTDSIGQIIECTGRTFDYYHLKKPDTKAIMSTIGLELSQALTSLLPEDKKHLGEQFTKDYREIFLSYRELQIDKIFEGTEELVKKIRERGLKIGYASGRSLAGIKRTLDATFLGDYCDAICGGSEVPSKPNPQMMNTVCQRLQVQNSQALGVGDSSLDILMYQNAGSMSVGVQTGVWSGDALLKLKPNLLLPKVGDLINYL